MLDPLQDERPEDLGGAHAVAPGVGTLEPAHQIGMDERDEFLVGVEKVGEGLQGRLQGDPLVLPFEIGEAQGPSQRPHRARCRRRRAGSRSNLTLTPGLLN